jgi:hypothetical protein
MGTTIKALHALNWYYGNICTRICQQEKQREHCEHMRELIRGHEDFLITHKMFVKIMHKKHHVCSLTDEQLRHRDPNFWKLDCMPDV